MLLTKKSGDAQAGARSPFLHSLHRGMAALQKRGASVRSLQEWHSRA